MSVKKVGNSGEAYVDAEESENQSFKNNEEKNPKLSDSNLKTSSIPENELKSSKDMS